MRAHEADTAIRAEIRRTAGAAYRSEFVSEKDSRARVVRDALADLAEVDRELLTLTVGEGMAPSEAAGLISRRGLFDLSTGFI